MKTTEQKVLKFIKENRLFKPGEKVLVGLSGGPDSVFAILFLNKFRSKLGLKLSAAHVNHMLRKDAGKDEQFCRELCSSLDIEFHSTSINIKRLSEQNKFSIEETARNERYRYFDNLLLKIKADKIVTAHNKNDNLETVLLNLFKGTGMRGLSGIPVQRNNIIRPFLNITKEEILDYLKETKTDFRIDESNLSNDYQRNFIRNEIIPRVKENINPNIEEAVFRTSRNISSGKTFIQEFLNDTINRHVRIENGEILIPVELIDRSGVFIISELIMLLAEREFGIQPGFENIKDITSLFAKQKGKELELADDLNVLRDGNYIVLYKKQDKKFIEVEIKAGETVTTPFGKLEIKPFEFEGVTDKTDFRTEIISADNIDNIFILRLWKNNDKFIPLGMKNFRKISDFLTDIKISSREKRNQLLLTNSGNIVWVVGRRIDDRYKIKDSTKTCYKLCLK